MKFRQGEWDIILAAYAYEVLDSPISSDSTYDLECRLVAENGTTIPNFDPSTGMWIHEVLKVFPEEHIKSMCEQMIKLGEGTSCLHVVKPEWLKE